MGGGLANEQEGKVRRKFTIISDSDTCISIHVLVSKAVHREQAYGHKGNVTYVRGIIKCL